MSVAPENLQSVFDRVFSGIDKAREVFCTAVGAARGRNDHERFYRASPRFQGFPASVFDEILEFPGGVFGIAFNVDER